MTDNITDGLGLTVQYHEGSDRYSVVSTATDADGVPLVEMPVFRAGFNGQDHREQFAVAIWELLNSESGRQKLTEIAVPTDV